MEVPGTHVKRNNPGLSLAPKTAEAREIPNFGVPPRGRTALKAKLAPGSVQRLTQLSGEGGKRVTQDFVGATAIPCWGRESPGPLIQELKIAERRAWGPKLPNVWDLGFGASRSQRQQTLADRFVREVMLRLRVPLTKGVPI